MRMGILGGTFDPVHYGHLLMAEICREPLNLDQAKFTPAGQPPHKPGRRISDGHARADMLQLAVSGYPEFVIDRRELKRTGPSFTVDTLTELRAETELKTDQSDTQLFFLIGADSLRDLPTWREPDSISQLATIVVCNRPGLPLPTFEQSVSWVGEQIASRLMFVQMPGTDLSATNMRQRIQDGKSLRFMTPRAVEAFIKQHRLYV